MESKNEDRLDLSKWAKWPGRLTIIGGSIVLLGFLLGFWSPPAWRLHQTLAASYITAYMFFLSLVLGSLFLVILHHLLDTYWLVPLRRFLEHIACLVPVLAGLFLPILLVVLSGNGSIYPWAVWESPAHDHALEVKRIMYHPISFFLISCVLFVAWWWLGSSLRNQSLEQDKSGAASCTVLMRRYAAGGIFIFAVTLTLAAFYWMKSLEYQWFSTMYGVYYFAGSVWMTLATTYIIALVLRRTGHLAPIIQKSTFKDIGTLFFAFTVFYAYIHFSQYFLIWNAAIPEETFWYEKRDRGVWHSVGLLLIFGHFFIPFLFLLRRDVKLCLPVMIPMCMWAWLMHYACMSFNVKPVYNDTGDGALFASSLLWGLGSMALMAGLLAKYFIKTLSQHPPFPQRDPRIAETLGMYVRPLSASSQPSNKNSSKRSMDEA